MAGSPQAGGVFAAEGAAVETGGGLIFTVKGLVHPDRHVVAYLRYVPDETGERVRRGVRYRRVYSFAEQEEALRSAGVDYALEDPDSGTAVQAIPVGDVVRWYDPRERLAELRREGPSGVLDETALGLAGLLQRASAVPWSSLGVTGSLLLRLHAPGSDVDMVVYGEAECRRVHAAVWRLLDDDASGLRRPAGAELAVIHAAHRADSPLTAAQFARHQSRKVNEGRYGGRPCFVRFVKLPHECGERYGEPRYLPAGRTVVEALVTSDADALFTPCRYGVAGCVTQEGEAMEEVGEIVSFRGRFADQARVGERVRACGTLERVLWRDRPETTRLVVGRAGDYLVRADGHATMSVR